MTETYLSTGCTLGELNLRALRRYTIFQMAKVSITQHMFALILRCIRRLKQPEPV